MCHEQTIHRSVIRLIHSHQNRATTHFAIRKDVSEPFPLRNWIKLKVKQLLEKNSRAKGFCWLQLGRFHWWSFAEEGSFSSGQMPRTSRTSCQFHRTTSLLPSTRRPVVSDTQALASVSFHAAARASRQGCNQVRIVGRKYHVSRFALLSIGTNNVDSEWHWILK